MLSVFLGETRISLGNNDFLLALAIRESNHTHYFLVSQPTNGARSRDQGAFCMAFATVFKPAIDATSMPAFMTFCMTPQTWLSNIDRELGKTESEYSSTLLAYPRGTAAKASPARPCQWPRSLGHLSTSIEKVLGQLAASYRLSFGANPPKLEARHQKCTVCGNQPCTTGMKGHVKRAYWYQTSTVQLLFDLDRRSGAADSDLNRGFRIYSWDAKCERHKYTSRKKCRYSTPDNSYTYKEMFTSVWRGIASTFAL